MKKRFSSDHIKVLERLGLTKNQAVLYLTSLQKGLLSALELERLTKVNRHQIYKDAERLIDLGLYESTSKTRKKYIPAPPSNLAKIGRNKMSEHEQVLSDIEEIAPSLEGLLGNKKDNVVITYYEGIERIDQGYQKELEQAKNTEVLSFVGSIKNTFEFFSEKYWDKWNKQFVKQRSKSRILVDTSEKSAATTHNDIAYGRETRFVMDFPLKVNIDVFNNSVFIVSFHDEVGIWIESSVVAASYKVLFKSLWRQAETAK